MEAKSPPLSEKRRFERVRVKPALAEALAVLSAQVSWPNHETSLISDLSYKGFAARRPGLFPIAVHELVDVRVELGELPSFPAKARVAWCTLDWVGLEVSSLPAEGHQAMHLFLEAKLLGTRLKPVERLFIGPRQSFQYWFQGPQETHVFVWSDSANRIEQVAVIIQGVETKFERDRQVIHPTRAQHRSLLVLSQMDKDALPMEEFVRSLGGPSGV